MSHIFISYSRFDRPVAEALAKALRAHSWHVWFDRDIEAGSNYRAAIDRALKEASCVLVLWSRHSVNSEWVLSEADYARDHDVLIPAMLDDSELPFGLQYRQCIDLRGWQGGPSPALASAVPAIQALMSGPAVIREYYSEGRLPALADGEWHSIAGPFAGVQALHVLASAVGQRASGRYALVEATALNAFNPPGSPWNPFGRNFLRRKTRIRATQAFFGSRIHRLQLRWTGPSDEYYLQVRSRGSFGLDDFGHPVEIAYSVKSLWTDPYGRTRIGAE